jgi:hypothetical protein
MLILNRIKNFIPFVFLFLFSSIGGILVYKTIEIFGPMFTPDSITYLQAAENFKNGYGISVRDADGFKILTHYPPLYPVILSFFFDNFKLLNSILAFITSFIFGFIVFDATGSIITSVLSIIFFSLSPTYIYIFSHLWSETLSLPFILLTCFLIKRYLDHQSTWLLILFSVLISVSTLIRYANLFFILFIALIFFLYRTKLSQFIAALFISSTGFIWLFIPYFFPSSSGPIRSFNFHLLSDAHLFSLIKTIRDYILPEQSAHWHPILIPITIVGLALGIALLIFSKRKGRLMLSSWEKILISASASYLLFFFIIISTVGFSLLLDKRYLSPFFIFMLAFLFIFLYKTSQSKLGGLIIYFTILLAYLPYTKDFVEISRKGLQWKLNYPSLSNLHIIEEIRKLPQDAYIYSNAPDLIYLHTKRFASIIPPRFFPEGNIPLPNFQDKLKEMANKLKEKDGFLVLIYPYSHPYLPTEDELNSLLDLQVHKRTQDGVIYKVRP